MYYPHPTMYPKDWPRRTICLPIVSKVLNLIKGLDLEIGIWSKIAPEVFAIETQGVAQASPPEAQQLSVSNGLVLDRIQIYLENETNTRCEITRYSSISAGSPTHQNINFYNQCATT